jgi:hypothetical protein
VLRAKAALTAVVCFAVILVVGAGVTGCGGGGGGGGSIANVTGTLADASTLLPLTGGVVTIAGKVSASTDSSGVFVVENVASGSRPFKATCTGYETASYTQDLWAGLNDLGTVYLLPVAVAGKGHLSGTVTDSSGVVAGAVIRAGGKTAVSREDGYFVIRNLNPGSVSVVAVKGAKSDTQDVTIAADVTTATNLSLTVSPPPPPVI